MNSNLINWNLCEKKFIRKVSVDNQRINSIILSAKSRLKLVKSFKVSEETVSFIVENYYEVIKELLIAYLLKDGLRSKNHQCMITYFYNKNPSLRKEALFISQMSYFRNRLCYYGDKVPSEFYVDNKVEIENIISNLMELLK